MHFKRAVAAQGQTAPGRAIFLGHRVEKLSFRELAERHGVSVAEIERAMIRSLRVIAYGKQSVTLEGLHDICRKAALLHWHGLFAACLSRVHV